MSSILKAAAVSAVALAGCAPAFAQTIYYEDGDYLYAVPGPEGESVEQDAMVTYQAAPAVPVKENTAVRAIPPRPLPPGPVPPPPPHHRASLYLPEAHSSARLPMIIPPMTHYGAGYAGVDGYSYSAHTPQAYSAPSGYLPNGAQLVAFDSDAWLSECSSRLAGYEERDRGRVIGTLAGALAGGVIGNRIADGNRLGGTLLGAGVGGLAGSAIGDSIDDRGDRRAYDDAYAYCADYLDDYLTRASNHGGGPLAYAPGQQYMLVPVSIPVAQQVVYRPVIEPEE
ncbi:glycine zipper domain-containing protein [Qipengyuania sp. MTN3-11]|uniref:glycine zipper domain-containing protein n=1 Tax=Qipengyuania sp. MTN3-11 TaxID=3056557 RepID=UPI0036F3A154